MRLNPVASQAPVDVGGVIVHPGALIVANFDGVVVVLQGPGRRILRRKP